MEIKNAVNTITKAANLHSYNIAEKLNIYPSTYAVFLNSDMKQINRLIKICEICGFQLQISDNKGLTIQLEADEKE